MKATIFSMSLALLLFIACQSDVEVPDNDIALDVLSVTLPNGKGVQLLSPGLTSDPLSMIKGELVPDPYRDPEPFHVKTGTWITLGTNLGMCVGDNTEVTEELKIEVIRIMEEVVQFEMYFGGESIDYNKFWKWEISQFQYEDFCGENYGVFYCRYYVPPQAKGCYEYLMAYNAWDIYRSKEVCWKTPKELRAMN